MLADKKKKGVLFARVEDRSFQAFKDFISETAKALFEASGGTPSTESDDAFGCSDVELKKSWKDYWRKIDENAK